MKSILLMILFLGNISCFASDCSDEIGGGEEIVPELPPLYKYYYAGYDAQIEVIKKPTSLELDCLSQLSIPT